MTNRFRIIDVKFNEKLFSKGCPATVTETGDIIRVQVLTQKNKKLRIKRINSDEYMVISTGEIKKYEHQDNRADNTTTLRKTFQHIRDLINTNISSDNIDCVRWITLTYAENMTDTQRLYMDFKKFVQRLRYWCKKNGFNTFEYIGVVEPQQRGAWHWHLLLIWSQAAPFIDNTTLRDIWRGGFVKITALNRKIDNVGLYLTAYMCDLELEQTTEEDTQSSNVKVTTKNGKRFVKGARLSLYPTGLHIYRTSRGIKQPKVSKMSHGNAVEYINSKNAKLQYEKNFYFATEDYDTYISKRYYNAHPLVQASVQMVKSYLRGRFYRLLYEDHHEIEYPELNDTICYRPYCFDDVHEEYLRNNDFPEYTNDIWADMERGDDYDCL